MRATARLAFVVRPDGPGVGGTYNACGTHGPTRRDSIMEDTHSADPLKPQYRRVILKLSGDAFGEKGRTGIDIEAPEGTPIRAVAAGAVAYRGWLKGYGNLLVLDHGDGYYTLYAHASQILVDEGDQVKSGALIGRVGGHGSWG